MAESEYASRIGLTLLAAAEVPNFLAGMLPSLMTIQRFGADDIDRAALRRGEILGSVLSLSIGMAASLLAEDALPFAATAIVLVVMLGAYEHAIRNPSPSARPIDDQDPDA